MATASFTISLRDVLSPVLHDVAAGLAAASAIGVEVWRRLGEAERELAHRYWEDEWFSLTGVPWRLSHGWPMLARLKVRLSPRYPMLSTIEVDGTRLGILASELSVDASGSQSVLRLAIPMDLVDLTVSR